MISDPVSAIRVMSRDLSLVEISNSIGNSTSGFSIGDAYSKGKRLREHSCWLFEVDKGIRKNFRDQLNYLLDIVEGQYEAYSKLNDNQCQLDITCCLAIENGQGAIELGSKLLNRFSKLDLNLMFDLYSFE